MKNLAIVLVTLGLLSGAIMLSASNPAPPPVKVDVEPTNPWTNLDIDENPDHFAFAIVTDRTGGHRKMVFEKAVQKLNLLMPRFVIAVGDLIEGGIEDQNEINRQWDEFQGFVRQLKVPFFYVPGNHDYSNPRMVSDWQKRFGRHYYHFLYKNCLFLVLNSQPLPQDKNRSSLLTEDQLAYSEKVLAENPNVRHTFLFMHKPLWAYGADKMGQGTGWPAMEKHLAGKRFTAFCGHHHRYETWTRNGNHYIQFATTGGGSKMRGKAFGEFDQIAWITVKDNGPIIANLLLDGIADRDIAADMAYDVEMYKAQEVQRREREKVQAERKAKQRQKAKYPRQESNL